MKALLCTQTSPCFQAGQSLVFAFNTLYDVQDGQKVMDRGYKLYMYVEEQNPVSLSWCLAHELVAHVRVLPDSAPKQTYDPSADANNLMVHSCWLMSSM